MSTTKNFSNIVQYIRILLTRGRYWEDLRRVIQDLEDRADDTGYKLTVKRIGTMRNRRLRFIFQIPLAYLYAGPYVDMIPNAGERHITAVERERLRGVQPEHLIPVSGYVVWDAPVGPTRNTEWEMWEPWIFQDQDYIILRNYFNLPPEAQTNTYQYLGMHPDWRDPDPDEYLFDEPPRYIYVDPLSRELTPQERTSLVEEFERANRNRVA